MLVTRPFCNYDIGFVFARLEPLNNLHKQYTEVNVGFIFSLFCFQPFFCFYQVKFVDPLLRSPIVNEVAYEALVKLSRCLAPPLCNSALDIATALRMIVTDGDHLLLDLVPSVGEAEANGRSSLGILERIVTALSIACRSGSLPIDTFTFIFPVCISLTLGSRYL